MLGSLLGTVGRRAYELAIRQCVLLVILWMLVGRLPTLLITGQEAPDEISCLAMDGDVVWAAAGRYVIKYIRGKEVSRVSPASTRFTDH